MKYKIFHIFLIFTLAGMLCSSNFLKELREEIQHEMKVKIRLQNIQDEDMILLSQEQLKDVEWLSKDEFKLNGELYDIVKSITINHNRKLYCIRDSKERKIRNLEERSLPLFSFKCGHQKYYFSSKVKTLKNNNKFFSKNWQEDFRKTIYNLPLKNYSYFLSDCSCFRSRIFPPPEFYADSIDIKGFYT